jgi:hypothetical protein
MIERYAFVTLGEEGHLLPPAHVVATGAVREDERGPIAEDLVEETDPVDVSEGHRGACQRSRGLRR